MKAKANSVSPCPTKELFYIYPVSYLFPVPILPTFNPAFFRTELLPGVAVNVGSAAMLTQPLAVGNDRF